MVTMLPDLRRVARWSVPVLALAIAFLSLTPTEPNPEGGLLFLRWIAGLLLGDPQAQDKVGHFVAYTALAGAGVFGFARIPALLLAGVAVGYGSLFEILQSFVPGRDSSLADLFANTLGVLAGWGLASILARTPLGASR
ncbi:VanZ family protein [Parvularcula lutaonensis]|uniref:VanZ family protein n=1 Tax=Parvularcula lutaonensis TaxID=491923 RepID=A0ABV7MA03_9PROT|nr:VanZ family protein [Parvularcula lutaonensis]GGY36316.1 hypothetical protein GCM10007148_00600 [Parvularcula lutaonensis]